MTLRQRRAIAWPLLLAFAALGLAWLGTRDYARKVSTDVLDLLPVGERDSEVALLRSLASEAEARTMYFALSLRDGASAPAAAAHRFAAELARAPEFEQAVALVELAGQQEAAGRELFRHRFTLLFPGWLAEQEARYRADAAAAAEPFGGWLARRTVAGLERFLVQPEAVGWQDGVGSDPLLLLPRAVDRLQQGLRLAPGFNTDRTSSLVWARIAASPLTEAGQAPVFSAIARAEAALQSEHAGARVEYTGVNRFAAASRARIQREVAWLNTASLITVFATAALFIRQLHRGLHLVPPGLLGLLGGTVAVTLAFDRVHVLVLVIGAMLIGVAIDYGVYLFLQPPAFPGEEYNAKVRRLLKPLVASCLTTVLGFALLLVSDMPLVRQVGVFVAAGLLCALGAALLYFGGVAVPHLPTRTFDTRSVLPAAIRPRLRRGLILLWALSLPGLAFITWRDDIRELEIPAADLRREDAAVRARFGSNAVGAVYLTCGASIGEAREALARFETWLGQTAPAGTAVANAGVLVPTAAQSQRARDFLRDEKSFPERLRAALAGGGFDVDGFAPFFAAYAEATAGPSGGVEPAVRSLWSQLRGPQASLLHSSERMSWFVTLTSTPGGGVPPADTQTVAVSQLQSLNRLFGQYRQSALRLSSVGLALVGLGILVTYGWRDGSRIFAIPCGACLGIFGVFGWLGIPLNMFHLLGAFLGVCLTHDYAIFSAASAYRHEPPPGSVRVSSITTAASFVVLAFSAIPVVRALGITVTSMVVVALVMIELEHFRPLGKPA